MKNNEYVRVLYVKVFIVALSRYTKYVIQCNIIYFVIARCLHEFSSVLAYCKTATGINTKL